MILYTFIRHWIIKIISSIPFIVYDTYNSMMTKNHIEKEFFDKDFIDNKYQQTDENDENITSEDDEYLSKIVLNETLFVKLAIIGCKGKHEKYQDISNIIGPDDRIIVTEKEKIIQYLGFGYVDSFKRSEEYIYFISTFQHWLLVIIAATIEELMHRLPYLIYPGWITWIIGTIGFSMIHMMNQKYSIHQLYMCFVDGYLYLSYIDEYGFLGFLFSLFLHVITNNMVFYMHDRTIHEVK